MTTSKKQYNHPTLEVIELDSIVSLQPTSETTAPNPGEFPDNTGYGGTGVEGGKTGNSELKSNSFSETPFK